MKSILATLLFLSSVQAFAHGPGECTKVDESELQKIEAFFDHPVALLAEELAAEVSKIKEKAEGAFDFVVTGFGCDPDYALDMAVDRAERKCWHMGYPIWEQTKRSAFAYVSPDDSSFANGLKVQLLIKCDRF